jgi:hypothetical protein
VSDRVLNWLADGKPLSAFCALPGSPSRRTVHDWRAKDPEFRRAFDFAREMGFETLAFEAIRIADEPPPDGVASRKWLAKKRLQVKTRFWLMSRWFPLGLGARPRQREFPAHEVSICSGHDAGSPR